MKQHPTANRGQILIESWEESKFEVHPLASAPIVQPNPEAIDTLSELISDHVATGGDLRKLVEVVIGPELNQMHADVIRRVLAVVYSSRRPRLVIDQLRWICGQADMEGESIGVLARRHGITKQAFEKGCRPLRNWVYLRSQSCRHNVVGVDRRQNARKSAMRAALELSAWLGRQDVNEWPTRRRKRWRALLDEILEVGANL